MFYINFTVGDDDVVIAEGKTKEEALKNAQVAIDKIKAEGKHGVISVNEGRGNIVRQYNASEV